MKPRPRDATSDDEARVIPDDRAHFAPHDGARIAPDDEGPVPPDAGTVPPDGAAARAPHAPDAEASDTLDDGALLQEEIDALMRALPSRIDADPEKLEAGLARLVLTLIEFLRRALEHQAVKRMEAGTLSVEEEERLGMAFLKLKDRMVELRNIFDLEEEDLNLDLGPLGRLL